MANAMNGKTWGIGGGVLVLAAIALLFVLKSNGSDSSSPTPRSSSAGIDRASDDLSDSEPVVVERGQGARSGGRASRLAGAGEAKDGEVAADDSEQVAKKKKAKKRRRKARRGDKEEEEVEEEQKSIGTPSFRGIPHPGG